MKAVAAVMMKLFLLLPLLVPSLASAQFVPAPTDLKSAQGYANVTIRYKQVPAGICELNETVKSYSGYADIEKDQHIFWWFFESRDVDPEEAPLTVWINGGPGSSSMIGLFQELGPCFIDKDGNPYDNTNSFSRVSNMLFIDQPAQVGHSYSIPVPGYVDPESSNIVTLPSNDCPKYAADWDCGTYSYPNISDTVSSTPAAAAGMWKTLQGFMGVFPQYSRNEFFFTTESYGGHYGPVFNEYFETQNAANIAGAHNISLAGVMIGNGWYDPIIAYEAYYNFTVSPGNTYDAELFNQSISDLLYNNLWGPGNCIDQIKDCAAQGTNSVCSAADSFCAAQVESIYDTYAKRDEYDMRELTPDPFPPSYFEDYLNTPKVQSAIGAYVNFTSYGNIVGTAFGQTGDDGRAFSIIEDLRLLLQQNVSVTIYSGDADYNCNWYGNQATAEAVNAPNFSKAGYVNITTSDGVVHGQVKQAGKFSFVRIYESGHEVPFYQPVVALEMFERVVAGRDIATGKHVADRHLLTVGSAASTYRQGNGTVQTVVVPKWATYNTTTNKPNPFNATKPDDGSEECEAKHLELRHVRSIV